MSITSGSWPGEAPNGAARRSLRVVRRQFGGLVRLNLLFCACLTPAAVLYAVTLMGVGGGWLLVPALIASVPLGGAIGASMFCVTRMLEGERVPVWSEFWRKFAQNWRTLAVPGTVLAAFVFVQLYLWAMVFSGADAGIGQAVLLALSLCVVLLVAPYVFLQGAYLDATIPRVLLNAVILSSSNAWRTVCGALFANVCWVGLALLLPGSLLALPLVVLVGFSASCLVNLAFIWPAVDRQFGISDELNARRARQSTTFLPRLREAS